MARPGPPPTPTALRVLHGDRPSRINRREPMPRQGKPVAPRWLTPEARTIFRKTLRELLAMRVATAADANALGLYAMALAEYVAASAIVARDGLVIKGRDGGPVANPAARIARDRWSMVARMGAEFGLSPSSRVSLAAGPSEDLSELESLLS
jgi:P27 family predicted phage terminase small subunit